MNVSNLPDVYQAEDFVNKFVGLTAYENKNDLILLLRKNGVSVSDNASTDDVILMTYLAIAQSPRFKSDLVSYAKSAQEQEEGKLGLTAEERKAARVKKREEQGGTKIGNLIRSVATEENIGTLLNTGLGFLSQKMTAKANEGAINAGAQYKASEAIAYAEQAKKEDAKANAEKQRAKWIVPVAIVAGIAVIGVIAFVVLKKKK